MSILDRLLGVTPVTQAAAVVEVPVGTAATSEGTLAALDPVAAAAFGINTDTVTVTEAEALRVPAVRRGRNLIAGTIAGLPLVCTRAGQPVERPLLTTLDPRTTPAWTIARTVNDLFFRPVSWWRVTARAAKPSDYPTQVEWLHRDRVQVQPATATRMGRVMVDGAELADRDLIRFDGLDDGLLRDGADAIRVARALMRATKRVADDDWSGLILRLAEGAPELNEQQISELLDAWEAARLARSTAYLNRAVDPEKISVSAQDRQLTELQRENAAELARAMNLPASRIGAPQGSGMTYTNTEADRRDLVDTTLAPFLTVIAQRLSMGDVTPAGQVVGFDLTAYLRGTTTELVTAGTAAIAAGITDAAEVRTRWLGLPPRTDLPKPQPAPAPADREDPDQ